MTTAKKSVKDKITINELINLKENGLTYREIGDMFGVSKERIYGLIKRYSDNTSYIEINDEIISIIKNHFESSELSLKQYSDATGVSYNIMRAIISNEVQKIKYENIEKIAITINMPINDIIHICNKNETKFLPSDTIYTTSMYKKIVCKTISDNINFKENKNTINGFIKISKDTANIIKAYRLSQNLSCTEFAEKVGMSSSRISQIENYNKLGIRHSSLKKIANTLNITIEKLLMPDESINIKVDFNDFKVKLKKDIGDKIKLERKRLNLSQEALGYMTSTTQDIVSRIEIGVLKSTKVSILNNICKVLNLDINDLIDNSNTKTT